MSPTTRRRAGLALLLIAAALLLAALFWPVTAHSEPVQGPRTGASLMVVAASERAATAADLAALEATMETRLVQLEARFNILLVGAAMILLFLWVSTTNGRLRLTAGPLSVETMPETPPPPPAAPPRPPVDRT